jgi:hypothetical protein
MSLALLPSIAWADSAQFYEDIWSGGASFSADSSVDFVGWDWNDRISSVYVPAGGTVVLYQDWYYGGDSLTLGEGYYPDLRDFGGPGDDGTWNDAASSIAVYLPPPPPQVFTVLVNGSLEDPYQVPWTVHNGLPIAPDDEWNYIAATYGVSPQMWPWSDNNLVDISPPAYLGIWSGGFALANFLNGVSEPEINVVAHSHGGNVAMLATIWMNRPIRHLIELATPVNWDFGNYRYLANYGAYSRCTASSTADWVQFAGSSPTQYLNFAYAIYGSIAGAVNAFQALGQGDYQAALAYFAYSVFEVLDANYWFQTTKVEWTGANLWFEGLSHSQMHEPPVWSAIAPYCAVD